MRCSRWILGLFISLLASGCPGQRPPVVPEGHEAPEEEKIVWRLSENGLGFRLSQADGDGPGARVRQVGAAPLDEKETAKLLARVPPIKTEPEDVVPFALRAKSLPPPVAGETVKEPFPPPAGPPPAEVPRGPLKVERALPKGDVPIAPHLAVTFSQPMVPVTSHSELARLPSPVKISPQPKGEWRWLGTQTVMFQPDPRFSMATEYSVDIPAGTRSLSGSTLDKAERFTFRTPPPRVLGFLIDSHMSRSLIRSDPRFSLMFDQAVDGARVLPHLRLEGGGPGGIKLRLATGAEAAAARAEMLADDYVAYALWAGGEPPPGARVLTFMAERPLLLDTSHKLVVRKGAPSAEGPLGTTSDQTFPFSTYGPLKLDGSSCSAEQPCEPSDAVSLGFSNPIDEGSFDPAGVLVDPPLADAKISAQGDRIEIVGWKKGNTRYRVTTKAGLRDVFGQELARDATAELFVGRAPRAFFPVYSGLRVQDPGGALQTRVFTVNHRALSVRLHAVTPQDYDAYERYSRMTPPERPKAPPGRLVLRRSVAPRDAPDELVETRIDLSPALKGGVGNVVAIIEPVVPPKDSWEPRESIEWIQVTRLGITSIHEQGAGVAWITELATGASVDGARVLVDGRDVGRSRPDGLAHFRAASVGMLSAQRGSDVAFLAGSLDPSAGLPPALRWFVLDGSTLYRPGEEVHLKGWIRSLDLSRSGDVGFPRELSGQRVTYTAHDGRGDEVARGQVELDSSYGFHVSFRLPGGAHLGEGRVALRCAGASTLHRLGIEEFRRPDFEVSMSTGGGPHSVGKPVMATVAAKYFAGGGLPGAEVTWKIASSEAEFTPPDRSDYLFGRSGRGWTGRLRSRDEALPAREPPSPPPLKGRTGPDGMHRVKVDLDALEPAFPRLLTLRAGIVDVNRQEQSARATMLVHPASVYVGLKLPRTYLREGEVIRSRILVSDLDGKVVPGRKVRVESARIDYERKGGRWVKQELDPASCALDSDREPSPCELATGKPGLYSVRATVTDGWGRRSQTEAEVYVYGSVVQDPELRPEVVTIVADRAEYSPGDTAELLVLSPVAPAEALLTVERSGIVQERRYRIEKPTERISLKLDPTWTTGVTVAVHVVGSAARQDGKNRADPSLPRRPAYGEGSVYLSVPPADRRIDVSVKPRQDRVDPGSQVVVDLLFRRPGGEPSSGARAAIAVVDEAVLALADYRLPEPLAAFYPQRPAGTASHELRAFVQSPEIPGASSSKGVITIGEVAIVGKEDDASAPVTVRKDFRPLAAFFPDVAADERGRAEVSFKLPDSLTRYRVLVVATRGEREFGKGEGTVTARLPLMVRPSPPRFLNFGDVFELPIVLQNQTDGAMSVSLAARSTNAALDDPLGRKVLVPANDRVEIRLPARAERPGRARFQLVTASGDKADAAEVVLPVWTPATTETFATYGVLDRGAVAQTVAAPRGGLTDFGGLEVSTSSTALQALTDAVLYLVHYPYDCAEQRASRVLAVAALRDVLSAFKARGMPSPEAVLASMKADLDALKSLQGGSGGWGFWRSLAPSPFVTLHVTHALVRAEAKGFEVDPDMKRSALGYLQSVESHIPAWYGVESRRALVAYALFVRELAGTADPRRARALLVEAKGPEHLSMEALGWLLPTLSGDPSARGDVTRILALLANRVTETSGAAHFTSSYSDGAHVLLHSDRRDDGVLLESLIRVDEKNTVIPKIVAGLLAHRTRGHWGSTNDNAFVLLALDRYFNTYEKATPDFVARAWLGPTMVAEHLFRGRTTERDRADVPMSFLAQQGQRPQRLVVGKEGPGRLYYRVGMQYAPSDLRAPPIDRGFVVTRSYEGAEDPRDVSIDADGVWHVKAGAKVRVRISMVNPARRYHVALVDPFPAGFEPMNPALATTGPIPEGPGAPDEPRWRRWWGRWYEHDAMRDDRVEVFTSLLWEGAHEYVYVARATTPGTFVVPPARAEEMYRPETFGRGPGDRVIVR